MTTGRTITLVATRSTNQNPSCSHTVSLGVLSAGWWTIVMRVVDGAGRPGRGIDALGADILCRLRVQS